MSRDLLNMPHIAAKLVQIQTQLAQSKPLVGSVPHPRRVLKEAAKQNQEASNGIKASKPRHRQRRKRKDKPLAPRGKAPSPIRSNGVVDATRGETDEGWGIPQQSREEIEDA
jgi:hypothetical protein